MTPPGERSDEELLLLMRSEQLGALEALYDRYHRLALAVAYRVVGSSESAEEIVQEAFLAVWRQAGTFQPERGRARDWLLSIVRHRAIDRVRRSLRPSQVAELDESLADRVPEVWEQASLNLQRERIAEALEALPPEQREAIELAYFGGLSHQDISERTGVALGTVKGRMRLAMEKLRLALADLAPEARGWA